MGSYGQQGGSGEEAEMRHRGSILATIGILASLAVMVASPAGATTSTSETIVLMRSTSLQPIGWTAIGTFTDSGSWAGVFGAFAADSAPVFAGTLKTVETGLSGTLSLDFTVLSSPVDGFGGNCQLTGGTGAYANYHGTGTWVFSSDATTRYYTCTMSAHQDP